MKNILLLTHIYPGEGTPSSYTPVVHYFAKEWVKMGYNVVVIHTSSYFPRFYYCLPSFLKRIAVKHFGCVLPEERLDRDVVYSMDGVKIFRWCLKKIIPSQLYSNKKLEEEIVNIVDFLKKESFRPDYIISHWVNPQIYLSSRLKEIYCSKTAMVLHDPGYKIMKFKNWHKLFDDIEVWGYRSERVREEFENRFGTQIRSFRCYSGIPEYYINNTIKRNWQSPNRYIFVGHLMERKYPDILVEALNESYIRDYTCNIIGEGEMSAKIESYIIENNLVGKVKLLGRQPRSEVKNYLDRSDIFVMISKNEVYGLVYIEAMARGCLVIASRHEGMEGIIKDGVNGFLCKAGDIQELKDVLGKIDLMTVNERDNISKNAMKTAAHFTDGEDAKSYIENVISL